MGFGAHGTQQGCHPPIVSGKTHATGPSQGHTPPASQAQSWPPPRPWGPPWDGQGGVQAGGKQCPLRRGGRVWGHLSRTARGVLHLKQPWKWGSCWLGSRLGPTPPTAFPHSPTLRGISGELRADLAAEGQALAGPSWTGGGAPFSLPRAAPRNPLCSPTGDSPSTAGLPKPWAHSRGAAGTKEQGAHARPHPMWGDQPVPPLPRQGHSAAASRSPARAPPSCQPGCLRKSAREVGQASEEALS